MQAAFITSAILGLVAAGPGAAAQDPATRPIDLALARQYFEDARSDSARDGGALWGQALYGPLLFADRATRFVVANQADAEGRLEPVEGLFIGTLPETEGIANTRTRWAGVEWTMVAWPLPADEGARRQLVCHELFHRIQPALGMGEGIPENGHLDERDGRTWLRLEWRALRRALEVEASDGRRQAVEDALLFRAVRRSMYAARADDECLLEINEGLAEYTGIVAGRPDKADQLRAAIAALDRYDRHPNFVRSFGYASGPPYGLLLDERRADWRREVRQDSDLGRMLAAAFDVRVGRADAEAARTRAAEYGGEAVFEEEETRHQVFLEQQAAFTARFVDGPLLVLPVRQFPQYTFDPNGVKSFGSRGTVYLTTRIVGEWGILEVTAGGALFAKRGDQFVRIVVPAPADPAARPVIGEGYTLQLNEGWTLRRIGTRGNYVLREAP